MSNIFNSYGNEVFDMCSLCAAGAPGIAEAIVPAVGVAAAVFYANNEKRLKQFFIRK